MSSTTTRTLGEFAAERGAGFGTSGVRGLVTSLTPGLCMAYAQAFFALLGDRPGGLLVGQDLRPSSPAIARAIAAAARRAGVPVVNAGVLPTPALAHAAQAMRLPAVMITGSHIPFDRNGLKFYRAAGEISKADEQRMLAFPIGDLASEAPAGELPPVDERPLALYRQRYLAPFGTDALRGMRIGVYEHSSVARDLLHVILRGMGAETLGLARSEGFIAIDTEAVRDEDRALARQWVREHHLDAIVTTDGDADRPLIADERGQWLRGDLLGLLAARELRAGTVATPVNSTTALEASGLFPEVRRTRIGSPHVIAAMADVAHVPAVGFEANGGFLLGQDVVLGGARLAALATRDAVLPMLLALTAARRRGIALSGLADDLPQRHTFSGRLAEVEPARCRALLEAAERDPVVMMELMGAAPAAIDRTDGLRAVLPGGLVLHVRPSGNAPELRCYAEAASPEAAERQCGACLSRLAGLLSGTTAPTAAGSG